MFLLLLLDVKGLIYSQNGNIVKEDIYVYEKLVELPYVTLIKSI